VLVRLDSIDSGFQLRVGEAVEYVLAAGSFALEAVDVCPLPAELTERPPGKKPS
jgi:hypothetical protein